MREKFAYRRENFLDIEIARSVKIVSHKDDVRIRIDQILKGKVRIWLSELTEVLAAHGLLEILGRETVRVVRRRKIAGVRLRSESLLLVSRPTSEGGQSNALLLLVILVGKWIMVADVGVRDLWLRR